MQMHNQEKWTDEGEGSCKVKVLNFMGQMNISYLNQQQNKPWSFIEWTNLMYYTVNINILWVQVKCFK